MCAIVAKTPSHQGLSAIAASKQLRGNMMLVAQKTMAHNNKRGCTLPTLSENDSTIYRALEDGNVTDHTATADSTIIRLRAVAYLYR